METALAFIKEQLGTNGILLAVGVAIILQASKVLLGINDKIKSFLKTDAGKRILSVAPLLLCAALAYVPGVFGDKIGAKWLYGLYAGVGSIGAYKFVVNFWPKFDKVEKKDEEDGSGEKDDVVDGGSGDDESHSGDSVG